MMQETHFHILNDKKVTKVNASEKERARQNERI